MANVNNPNGFQYLTLMRPFPPRTRSYDKLAAQTVAIFQNDVVTAIGGSSGHDAPPIKSFNDGATPGTTIPLGVSLNFGAANLATKHTVIVEEECEFHAQDNSVATGLLATDMGKNANVDPSGVGGSTLTGFSGNQIDQSTVNVSASRDLMLLRRFPDILNAFGPNCRVIVKFTRMREVPGTVGV